MLDDERDGYSHEDLTETYSSSFEAGASCTCDDGEDSRTPCEACK